MFSRYERRRPPVVSPAPYGSQEYLEGWKDPTQPRVSGRDIPKPNFQILTDLKVHDTLYLSGELLRAKATKVGVKPETVYAGVSKEPLASQSLQGEGRNGEIIGVRVLADVRGDVTTELTVRGKWKRLSVWLFENPEGQREWDEYMVSTKTQTNKATLKEVVDFAIAQAS